MGVWDIFEATLCQGIPLGCHFIIYAWQIAAKELAMLDTGVRNVRHRSLGRVTGYQVIRVIRIFAKTYPFE